LRGLMDGPKTQWEKCSAQETEITEHSRHGRRGKSTGVRTRASHMGGGKNEARSCSVALAERPCCRQMEVKWKTDPRNGNQGRCYAGFTTRLKQPNQPNQKQENPARKASENRMDDKPKTAATGIKITQIQDNPRGEQIAHKHDTRKNLSLNSSRIYTTMEVTVLPPSFVWKIKISTWLTSKLEMQNEIGKWQGVPSTLGSYI
jgi:hypothetical protein